jgi:hypothetical protein
VLSSKLNLPGGADRCAIANAIELAGGNPNVTIKHNVLREISTDGYNGIFLHDNFRRRRQHRQHDPAQSDHRGRHNLVENNVLMFNARDGVFADADLVET